MSGDDIQELHAYTDTLRTELLGQEVTNLINKQQRKAFSAHVFMFTIVWALHPTKARDEQEAFCHVLLPYSRRILGSHLILVAGVIYEFCERH